MTQFIDNKKINNKFDMSRFIQNDVSTLSSSLLKCSQFQIFIQILIN